MSTKDVLLSSREKRCMEVVSVFESKGGNEVALKRVHLVDPNWGALLGAWTLPFCWATRSVSLLPGDSRAP